MLVENEVAVLPSSRNPTSAALRLGIKSSSQKAHIHSSSLSKIQTTFTHTMPQAQPELKKVPSLLRLSSIQRMILTNIVVATQYLDKRLFVQLNGSRKVIGVLRGYDVRLYCRYLSLSLSPTTLTLATSTISTSSTRIQYTPTCLSTCLQQYGTPSILTTISYVKIRSSSTSCSTRR